MLKETLKEQSLHDQFFKTAFTHQEVAAEYIQKFLPKEIVQKLHFVTLTPDANEYLTPELNEFYSDVVWQCAYGRSKKRIKIAFLLEHKSYIPKYPQIQLLRYILENWDKNIKENESLIPVIPIIVYHNKQNRQWKKKPMTAYFKGIDKALLSYIPVFDYILTDLTTFSAEMLLALDMGLLAKTFLTLRFGSDTDFVLKNLEVLLVEIENKEHLKNFLIAQFVYISKNIEISSLKLKEMIQNLPKSAKRSAYDLIIEQGIEQGIEKGEEKEKRKMVINLIHQTDFDNVKIAAIAETSLEFVQAIRKELLGK